MEDIEFKFSVNWTKSFFFCGLDVHKHELAVAIYSKDDSQSEFLKTNVFSVDSAGLERFWNFAKKYRPCGFVMEATGIYHHIIFNFLKIKRTGIHWPFKITVVNPADAAGLPGRQKFDKIDAENLARYLAMGLLKNGKPIIQVLEDLKAIFRMASKLERDRTALKNRIKKTLDRAGIRPRKLDLNNEWVCELLYQFIEQDKPLGVFIAGNIDKIDVLKAHRHKILKNISNFAPYFEFSLTSAQRTLIRQNLVELDFKTARKSLLAIEIDQLILERPGLRRHAHNLASIPGISPFSATWILAEVGNIRQFPSVKQYLAYCGCCPRIVSSAGKVYSAHISRHSNSYLRTIFYNAAVVLCNLVKKESVLKEYATRIVKRKSLRARKLAYCIVAAKIAKVSYYLLQKNVPFDPNHGRTLASTINNMDYGTFSITDKKTIRRVRNLLNRVGNIDNIGLLGEYAVNLATGLDLALQGKKI